MIQVTNISNIELGDGLTVKEVQDKALFLKEAIADTSSTIPSIQWKFDLTHWQITGKQHKIY